ncbi:MAG: hypothetical protein HQ475_05475 [SAR202 cluster bacterium]|nr:hypothetical protein [SAR202 cluster bacterium]
MGCGVAVGTGVGVAVGCGVAVGGTGVGVGTGVAVAVGSGVRVGRARTVGGGVGVWVDAGGLVLVTTAVLASDPTDCVQAAKAMKIAAAANNRAVSFNA